MAYTFHKETDYSFDEAVEKVTAELKNEGFGVLTQIDVQQTLKDKIGVDFQRYRILGACNPGFAHKALSAETRIGTMLPCNVIVHQLENGKIEIAAVDPIASMQGVENAELGAIATEVRNKLQAVIERV